MVQYNSDDDNLHVITLRMKEYCVPYLSVGVLIFTPYCKMTIEGHRGIFKYHRNDEDQESSINLIQKGEILSCIWPTPSGQFGLITMIEAN